MKTFIYELLFFEKKATTYLFYHHHQTKKVPLTIKKSVEPWQLPLLTVKKIKQDTT